MNYKNLRFSAAVIWTIIMLIGCLLPGPDVPPVITMNDKFTHVGIFILFAVLWSLSGRRPVWVILAGLFFGILIEVLQGALPIHRSADVQDAIADLIGTLIGAGLAVGMQRFIKS